MQRQFVSEVRLSCGPRGNSRLRQGDPPSNNRHYYLNGVLGIANLRVPEH
jgi:hypothetical protein